VSTKSGQVQWFHRNASNTAFEGSVSRDGFSLVRVVKRRAPINPRIRGRFIETPSGTLVSVTMWLHPLMFALLLLWSYWVVKPVLTSGRFETLGLDDALTVGVAVVAWVIIAVSFYVNAVRSRNLIIQLLELHGVAGQGG